MSAAGWPIVVIVCLMLRACCAWAQGPQSHADGGQSEQQASRQQARQHFDRAELAYRLTRYEEAIRGYEKAYMVFPNPDFLFNVAQAYRRQHQLDPKPSHLQRARTLYKNYLRDAPRSHNRELVRSFIDQIETTLAHAADTRPVSLSLSDGQVASAALAVLRTYLTALSHWPQRAAALAGLATPIQWAAPSRSTADIPLLADLPRWEDPGYAPRGDAEDFPTVLH